jgi:nitrile hydratase
MVTRFKVGDRVRVLSAVTSGHCRTPAYIRGKTGSVAAIHGAFPNPESRAYGGDGRPEPVLYLVSFDQTHVWEGHMTSPGDKLFIDLFEHWLVPA